MSEYVYLLEQFGENHGASLAVTAQMYAGGLPPVRTPEDVAFYRALVRVNARFRHVLRCSGSQSQIGYSINRGDRCKPTSAA